MKKIIFDALKTGTINSGLGKFCDSLGNSIYKENKKYEIKYIVKEKYQAKNYYSQQKLSFSQKFIGFKDADLLHCTHQESRFFSYSKNTKVLLTIHDLNFLEKNYSDVKKKKKLALVQKKIKRAHAISYISNYTKELVNMHLNTQNKIEYVVYNGNPLDIETKIVKPLFIEAKQLFFFSIGLIQEKKNFHVLIPLLKFFPNHKLIIAGKNSGSYAKKIEELAKELEVQDQLILPGEINESNKIWLYKNCDSFLFPSLAEGFGLPIIEALSLGVNVVCSNKTSLPEIGKDFVTYITNFEPEEMKVLIQNSILKNTEEERTLKINYAKNYSWQTSAQKYLDIYDEILNS